LPTVLKISSYRFHFYSNEGDEPPHIHVAFDDSECKFWLNPVGLAKNMGIPAHRLREIERMVYQNQEFLLEKFHEHKYR
jgi:hypothetical protein